MRRAITAYVPLYEQVTEEVIFPWIDRCIYKRIVEEGLSLREVKRTYAGMEMVHGTLALKYRLTRREGAR